jgi:hypothetical protein
MKTVGMLKNSLGSGLGKVKGKLGKVPNYIWFLTAFVIVTLTILAVFFPSFLSQLTNRLLKPFPQAQKENVATPAEPRIVPLATGKQIYNISGGTKGGPQMTQAVIDPIDPKPSQIQTFTLKANNLKPIVEIKAIVITDNGEKTNYLKLISGTNVDGVWQGSWRITDDYDYSYQIRLVAKNNEDTESKTTMTFR